MTGPPARSLAFGGQRLDLPRVPFPLQEVAPSSPARAALDPRALAAALDRPIASPGLDEIFRGARRVLVVVSDITRATGAGQFLPPLLDRIRRASRAEVTFVVASGIHRRPSPQEIESILGAEVAARHPAVAHDPDDGSRLVAVGRTPSGTPVRVNAAVLEHDRLVLTGAAGFHYYAGFSGGRKAVVPGLAARETVTRNHLHALRQEGSRHPGARAGALRGNPVHRDMAAGAALLSPHLLVNSVLDERGGIERLFVGHWRRAHEAACRYLRARRSVRLEPRGLVVASAGGSPSDINVIQAHKAFEAAWPALEPGGVFVLVASCREGAGHPDFSRWMRLPDERAMVRELRSDFRVYGQTALSWHRKARECRLILVSDLDPREVRGLGAEPARDLEEALRLAAGYIPTGATGWLFTQGTRLLVEPEGGNGR